MFCKDCPDIDICSESCLKDRKQKPILDRHIFEVRYLFKRGNYTGAYAPRVKTFYDCKKALSWAKKYCEIYCVNELIYDANNAEYFSVELIAWGIKE